VALDIIVLEGYGSLTMRKLASRLSMTARTFTIIIKARMRYISTW
jgi:hypothetical protein